MEILRFEEASTSAPKRKKSSKGYLAVGLVATLFGVSSAFATNSITINANNNISLGQGVSSFTTCDDKIAVIPTTVLKNTTAFRLSKVTIGAVYGSGSDKADYLIDDGELSDNAGCKGADFMVKFYAVGSTTALGICTAATYGAITISGATIGTSAKCVTDAIYFRVAQDSHEITFATGGTADSGFFDRISIETTSTTYTA